MYCLQRSSATSKELNISLTTPALQFILLYSLSCFATWDQLQSKLMRALFRHTKLGWCFSHALVSEKYLGKNKLASF